MFTKKMNVFSLIKEAVKHIDTILPVGFLEVMSDVFDDVHNVWFDWGKEGIV